MTGRREVAIIKANKKWEEERMNINEIICARRTALGMTQEQVADCLGVCASAVYEWEAASSYPDITLLPALARLLHTDVNTLLGFEETLSGGESAQMAEPSEPVTVSPEDIMRVKAWGFLQNKGTDRFNARVITRNGKITAEQSRCIAEAAQRFGSGELAMTSRLTVEIQGVPYQQIDSLRAFLQEHGMQTGGTGAKVRPVVSCKGTTCQYGLADTFALSEKIHKRFYEGYAQVKLPHKFKIAVGGCPNNCVKPNLNDLGIVGQRIPSFRSELCRGCKVCQIEKACPVKAARVVDGVLKIDKEKCLNCGRCISKCPFQAMPDGQYGYRIYIGGRWGKKFAHGRPLTPIVTSEEEVMQIVEKAILLFREQGQAGERFSDTIERLGFENVQEQLLGDGLLERKDEIIGAKPRPVGGAVC